MPDDLEKKVEELAKKVSSTNSALITSSGATMKLREEIAATNKSLQEIAAELKRMQHKLKGLDYSARCCFKMLEDMTKDRKEKHKQHFAFMNVTLKVLEKIAKKLDLEVTP